MKKKVWMGIIGGVLLGYGCGAVHEYAALFIVGGISIIVYNLIK